MRFACEDGRLHIGHDFMLLMKEGSGSLALTRLAACYNPPAAKLNSHYLASCPAMSPAMLLAMLSVS